MKKYKLLTIICIVFTFIFVNAQSDISSQIKNLVATTMKIDKSKISKFSPIQSINELAKETADTLIFITRDNMNDAMKTAKKYKNAFITVEDHTILKIIDYDNAIISGSWATKMPYGKGYVKKSMQVTFREDHINYIIGLPDNQIRRLFLYR